MSSNTSTRFAFCVNTARFLINRVLCCSRRATRRKSSATFRLNALMACRILSATEHHTLQQAGRPSGARGKRRKNGGDEEALCPRDLLQQTQQHCENSETYCYSDRKSRFFFFFWDCASLCACLRGTHSIMRRIWVDTSHSRSIAGVEEEEEEEGRWIIQPASAARLWRLVVSYGEVRQQQAAPPHKAGRHMTAPG